MNSTGYHSPLPNSHADDEEIRRYGVLLDSLDLGLLVFSSDASPCFRNEFVGNLLGDALPVWVNESGQTIPDDELPLKQALHSSRPVFDRIMTISNHDEASPIRMSVNALPLFSENGGVRRVLLTMTDISEKRGDRDPLTGVFKQHRVMQLLENEIHRARRYGTPFALAQIDIDQFFPFCTQYGQQVGDTVLAGIGKLLNESMREIDFAGRIGYDRFLLVLPNVSLKDALVGLERLRVAIETTEFTSACLRVTISGGIAEYTGENSAALVESSTSLLIQARESGRNRFCLDADIL
jgi:diguanylate cyclase (GGDEF)-like protein